MAIVDPASTENFMEMLKKAQADKAGTASDVEDEVRELSVDLGYGDIVYNVPEYLLEVYNKFSEVFTSQRWGSHKIISAGFDALNRAIAGLSANVQMPDAPVDSSAINDIFWQGVEAVFVHAVNDKDLKKEIPDEDERAQKVFEQMKQGLSYIV